MIRIPPTTSPRSILLSVPENTAPFAGTGASAASREARRSRLSRNEVVPGLFAPPVEKGQSHDASETVGAEQTARSTESAVSARESERLARESESLSHLRTRDPNAGFTPIRMRIIDRNSSCLQKKRDLFLLSAPPATVKLCTMRGSGGLDAMSCHLL